MSVCLSLIFSVHGYIVRSCTSLFGVSLFIYIICADYNLLYWPKCYKDVTDVTRMRVAGPEEGKGNRVIGRQGQRREQRDGNREMETESGKREIGLVTWK
jgi:hypothetical protein